jgi:competence protein ComEC
MCALYLPGTPEAVWFPFLPALVLFALTGERTRLPLLFVVGWLWASLNIHLVLSERLAPQWYGTEISIEGTVADIPDVGRLRTRFLFDIERVGSTGREMQSRVALNWYRSTVQLQAGDRWRRTVKLKQPHGYTNPGGFDYERWLFAQRIAAVGYVRGNETNNKLLGTTVFGLQRLRQRAIAQISQALERHPSIALVLALSVGHKALISSPQWDVLRNTGTAHLMVISGLHVGLVAGLVYWMTAKLWGHARLAPDCSRHRVSLPARRSPVPFHPRR